MMRHVITRENPRTRPPMPNLLQGVFLLPFSRRYELLIGPRPFRLASFNEFFGRSSDFGANQKELNVQLNYLRRRLPGINSSA